MQMHNPSHPGEILKECYIESLELTITETAKKLGVTRNTLSNIVNEKTGISPEMAFRLAKAFNTTPEYWMNMQQQYDLWQAKKKVNLDNVDVIYKAG